MQERLNLFKRKEPAIVFEWNDPESEAQGWVVINSLRGGAAGGGTRMRKGLDRSEVESLAKVMEIKFSVSGPPIGGAKSGINFDPNDPRRDEVLRRWYEVVSPLLKNYYGTGGDLNIDEVKDVIPITEDFGIWHPQEGIVNGHFRPRDSEKIHLIGQLRAGVSKVVEDIKYTPSIAAKYLVADMITGYGVAESVRHFYKIFKSADLNGKTAIIQGWGNVASAAAFYLAQEGVKIIGILDKDGGLLNPDGYSFEEVKALFNNKKGNKLSDENMLPFDEVNAKLWDMKADIFIPAAASRLLSQEHMNRMTSAGVEVISSGANVPFQDEDIFFGDTAKFVDGKCSLIPDFVANLGMARVFAYLMQNRDVELSDDAIFGDVSHTIQQAIQEIYNQNNSGLNVASTAFNIALNKIMPN